MLEILIRSGTKLQASVLNERQFVHIDNTKDGSKRIVQGPCLVFLNPYEALSGAGVQSATALRPNEYLKLLNEKTGEIRVERGEKLVFLEPFESIIDGVKKVISN